MRRLLLIGALALAACSDTPEAETDLPEEQIATHDGATDVILNADRFPNFAHTCWEKDEVAVGFWSTTDRIAIIVYNDWLCPGSSKEREMTVLSGNPRAVVQGGS